MKVIKFRVWDKINKKMLKVEEIDFRIGHLIPEKVIGVIIHEFRPFEEFEIMQYAGLNDMTTWEELREDERVEWGTRGNLPSAWVGKEIYEGDIICFSLGLFKEDESMRNIRIRDIVFFSNGAFIFKKSGKLLITTLPYRNTKVIGNIYENPELIELSELNEK